MAESKCSTRKKSKFWLKAASFTSGSKHNFTNPAGLFEASNDQDNETFIFVRPFFYAIRIRSFNVISRLLSTIDLAFSVG